MVKAAQNHIFVKPERTRDDLIRDLARLPSGLYVDTSWDSRGRHAVTCGEVMSVGECHYSGENNHDNVLLYDTDCEVQVGDIAVFDHREFGWCMQERKFWDEGNTRLFAVRYSQIVCVKRGEQIIPVNGYILVEPEEEQLESAVIDTIVTRKKSLTKGTVKYIGTPVRAYLENPFASDAVFRVWKNGKINVAAHDLTVGDKVCFKDEVAMPLQFYPHNFLGDLLKMQRRDLVCVL